jgi:predicted metal-binding membrane protein
MACDVHQAAPTVSTSGLTPQERTARIVATLVFLISAAVTWNGIRGMSSGMPMPGGWQMSTTWMAMPGSTFWSAAWMFLLMWQAMMIAMMLPSSWPMLELHHRVAGSSGQRYPGLATAFAGTGYFTVWLGFGVVVFAAGYTVSGIAMRSAEVSRMLPVASGTVLILAGAYQVTPLKRACLDHCRSPLMFLGHAWRPGLRGALRLGIVHGVYCAGCCGALMAIQTVLGIMNLGVMILIAAVIAVEKLWKHGPLMAKLAGAASAAFGVYVIAAALMRA